MDTSRLFVFTRSHEHVPTWAGFSHNAIRRQRGSKWCWWGAALSVPAPAGEMIKSRAPGFGATQMRTGPTHP